MWLIIATFVAVMSHILQEMTSLNTITTFTITI